MTTELTFSEVLTSLQSRLDTLLDEADRVSRAIDALKAIQSSTTLSQITSLPAPEPANGFDRTAVRNQVLGYHIGYPLKHCYRTAGSAFVHQALYATIVDHPDFQKWMVHAGFANMNSVGARSRQSLIAACDFLGLDYGGIRADAQTLWHEIMEFGEAGKDYTP